MFTYFNSILKKLRSCGWMCTWNPLYFHYARPKSPPSQGPASGSKVENNESYATWQAVLPSIKSMGSVLGIWGDFICILLSWSHRKLPSSAWLTWTPSRTFMLEEVNQECLRTARWPSASQPNRIRGLANSSALMKLLTSSLKSMLAGNVNRVWQICSYSW